MKTFFGYPCIGIAVVVLVAVSVLFTGCTNPTDQQIPAATGSPGVTAGQGAPAPVRYECECIPSLRGNHFGPG